MTGFIKTLLDLVYPPKCPFCRRLSQGETAICAHCLINLPYTPLGLLPRKGKYVDEFYSALYYKGSVRESILRYKFNGVLGYAEFYAPLLRRCADENGLSPDVVTWVPLSSRRLRQRGYDQARLLAEPLSEYMGLDCEGLIKKHRHNKPQSGRGAEEQRQNNVHGVYRLARGADVAGKCVLIVDDVVTTGSTLDECAKILKQAGAKKILALTLACTMD